MGKTFQLCVKLLLKLFLLIIILLSPSFFSVSESGKSWNWLGPVETINQMKEELATGDFFTVQFGKTPRDLREIVPAYFSVSLLYIALSTMLSILLGLGFGIFLGIRKANRSFSVLTLISALPDFIIIIILQLASIFTYTKFGFRLGRFHYATGSPFLSLAFMTILLISLSYSIRMVYRHTTDIAGQEYIATAKARGISKRKLLFGHLLPALIVRFQGDLYKLIALAVGSLFIVERMFSIPGLTRLLFAFGFSIAPDGFMGIVSYTVHFRIAVIAILLLSLVVYLDHLIGMGLLHLIRLGATYGR